MEEKTLRDWYHEFRSWQERPYEVAPLSGDEHVCCTCQTHFQGNYCPRCGQSARISRYSFKTALLNFFDVWGLGNRSMFRTIRDLILRPGYMIRDYLRGMQMAYFPPCKLLFLLTALTLLVSSGFNIKGENRFERANEIMENAVAEQPGGYEGEEVTPEMLEADKKIQDAMGTYMRGYLETVQRFPNVMELVGLVLLSGLLYLFFYHSPNIHFRYSEFLVSLVYINNMLTIFGIVLSFFCVPDMLQLLPMLLIFVPLKQLSGYGWFSTIWRVLLPAVIITVVVSLAFAVFIFKVLAESGAV